MKKERGTIVNGNMLVGTGKNSCSSKVSVRNGKIELLRFFFATIIVFHHSRSFLGENLTPFLGGSLAVEFFFLVSGYLMMSTIEKRNQSGNHDCIGKETANFILKKWYSVFPEAIISWFIAFTGRIVAKKLSIGEVVSLFIDSIWELLLLSMTGLGQRGINSVVWYISAMLICMAILYPLLRKYHDMMIHVVIPLTSLLILGWLFRNYGSPRDPTKWLGWAYKGVLRAFAELGLGCLVFYLSKKISSISFNKKGKILIATIENICYLAVTVFMYLQWGSKHDYFFILLFAFAIGLTFSGQGIDNKLFNNKHVYGLGLFSVPLYFCHTFYATYLNEFVPTFWRIRYRLSVYLIISFATAIMVMAIAKVLRKSVPIYWKKFVCSITENKEVSV